MWKKKTAAFLCKLVKPCSSASPTAATAMMSAIAEAKVSGEHQSAINATSKNVEEADVGILCYISQLPGFRGVLKQRYHQLQSAITRIFNGYKLFIFLPHLVPGLDIRISS